MALVGSYVGLSRSLVAVLPVFLLAWLRFLIAALAMPHWLRRTPGEHVLGMLWWVLLGLVPAGIGALILSPLVAHRALYILTGHDVEGRERRMAALTILLAGIFGLLGGFFTFLLILHLIG